MTDLERAKEALTTIDCTCALCRDEEVRHHPASGGSTPS